MERLTYRLEDQYGNPTDSIILESDLIFLNSSEKWKKVLSRLAAIEDILGDEYDLERLRELAQADREGLVHIIQGPDPGATVCGNCWNFIRNPGKRTGVCTEQSCYRDHHGNEEPWRGTFSPSQSRKACRKFVRRGKDKP